MLKTYSYPGQGTTGTTLVECPLLVEGGPEVCGHVFGETEARWRHFFDEHGPADVPALTPGREYSCR